MKKTYTKEGLAEILERHIHWLREDCEGWRDMRADLSRADLSGADLSLADLSLANLSWANLSRADLSRANLSLARNVGEAKNMPFIPFACPDTGAFIGWKAALDLCNLEYVIVKLKIPDAAKRSSATGAKCRCDRAKVLEIQDMDGKKLDIVEAVSGFNNEFKYVVGKTVKVDDFNENRWEECAAGIHFFVSRKSAVEYAKR